MKYELKKYTLPMIAAKGGPVFPHMVLNFDIVKEKSINALEKAMMEDQKILVVAQKDSNIEILTKEDFYKVGTVCKVNQMVKLPGEGVRALLEGVNRAKVESIEDLDSYFEANIQEIIYEEGNNEDLEEKALLRKTMDAFIEYVNMGNRISPEIIATLEEIDDCNIFCDLLIPSIQLKGHFKQEFLENIEPKNRLEAIYKMLLEEIEVLKIERKISIRIRKEMNRVQKEYYLREQLKAIRKELGEDFDQNSEIDEFRKKLKKLKLKKSIKEKINKELDRLARLNPSSSESGVIRNYIDNFFLLPWNKESKDNIDVKKTKKILDKEHYGIDKVKERIIEYLAVKKLSKTMKGPIICLVGPPGVGKTSIASSIAKSLNREFVRISLGGVRDESEIRGHRRTYVGAMPGRIINALKEAKVKNPVILFDEIDKMASDFKGDPSSAMLEVLDPEQNNTFLDHYMEIEFDLSKVLFLTTANSLSTIPRPLRDRMEIIEVSGYTHLEKLQICKRYLLKKQEKENGLLDGFIKISDNTLLDIIDKYTRESGVRELERVMGKICRKAAKKLVDNDKLKSIRITKSNLEKYLGKQIYKYEKINEKAEIGIVRGLAWTPVGGDTLSIEVNLMKGSGKIALTGKLGDVMKESAKAGISYIRSRIDEFDIDKDFHKNLDIHIHIPEGAVPKDGPSAGITMATALISALCNKPVRRDIAMTGEITLRGRVLPIGGLKEKVLAANRAGIKKVLLPIENEKDIDDIPASVKKNIELVPVSHMDEVLKQALVEEEENENKKA